VALLYAAAAALFSVVALLVSVALAVTLSGFPVAVVVALWLFSVAIVVCCGVCYSYCCYYQQYY
jgi:hypothetical protein